MKQRKIKGGLYLVVDPNMEHSKLLLALDSALESQVIAAVQIWDHWPDGRLSATLINEICRRAHRYHTPVLTNNQSELLWDYPLDGVHFDTLPTDIGRIKKELNRPVIVGVTLSNDIRILQEVHAGELDYFSFCSIFPSSSAHDCEIVQPAVVDAARAMVDIPLFLAGGINMENIKHLAAIPFDGIAVISGIMNDDNPKLAALEMYESINKIKTNTI